MIERFNERIKMFAGLPENSWASVSAEHSQQPLAHLFGGPSLLVA